MANEDVNIRIEIESKDADKFFITINQKLAKTEKAAKETEKSFSKIPAAIGVAAAGLTALGAAATFAINEARKIEDLQTSFISFTGSAEAAAKQVERIAEFSTRTPFQLEQLAQANRTLLAFGSSTEESLEQLRQLGEVASATGKDIGELSTIFGQIQAEGKLTTERFNQLVERGVNIGPTLAKSLGVAESSLKELRAAGKITSDDVAEAFRIMTSEGGQFFGATERQSLTLSGSLSTLDDNVSALAARIGERLAPSLIKATAALNKLIGGAANDLKTLDPLSERIKNLTNEIDKNQQKIGIIEGRLKRIGEVGEDAPQGVIKSFQTLNAQLQTASDQTERLEEKLRRLRSAQSKPILQQREQEADDQRTKKAEEEAAKKKAIEEAEAERRKKLISATESQITQIIAQEETVRTERLRIAAQTNNTEAVRALAEREATLAEKRIELEAVKLGQLGQFKEAETLRLTELEQAKQERLTEATVQGENDRIEALKKAQKEEFNLAIQTQKARVKFDESTYSQRVRTASTGLAALANLQSAGSEDQFRVGKAAALAQAAVSIPTTAIEAYKSLAGIPVVGPALGAAAAAAAILAGVQQVNKIKAQQFTAMAEGGQVPPGFPNDSFPALLSSGEVVVPERNFEQIVSGVNPQTEEQTVILKQILFAENRLIELTNILINTVESSSGGRVINDGGAGDFFSRFDSLFENEPKGRAGGGKIVNQGAQGLEKRELARKV